MEDDIKPSRAVRVGEFGLYTELYEPGQQAIRWPAIIVSKSQEHNNNGFQVTLNVFTDKGCQVKFDVPYGYATNGWVLRGDYGILE